MMKINTKNIVQFIDSDQELMSVQKQMVQLNKILHDGSGKGNDFLGWINLPSDTTEAELDQINSVANDLRGIAEVVVFIGIGGSYLGAKAVIEAMQNPYAMLSKNNSDAPYIIFAGEAISEDNLSDMLEAIKHKSIATIVISKSGTTTEPAIAFRFVKSLIEQKYDKDEAARRIVAITDRNKGALRQLADSQGYRSFIIEDNVGGRFSVLTAVGLLPMAIAGIDIKQIMEGARNMQHQCGVDSAPVDNPAIQYAAARNILYKKGKKIEILASYEPRMKFMGEWWKQLYAESEGKNGKGIFPTIASFTTDLHSIGQYIQQGERSLFETVIKINKSTADLRVPEFEDDSDGLNYLAGKRLSQINDMAMLGTNMAHMDGGVPIIEIEIEKIDEYCIGELIYMFEKACGISGYYIQINPFDQPGVEDYKRNMFALLRKPGYEKESEEIYNKINTK